MKYNITILILWGITGCCVHADHVVFSGTHSLDFSEPGNWSTFPAAKDSVVVSAPNMSRETPVVIDAGFSVPLGLTRIYPTGSPRTTYVAIVDGATLSALAVIVGNPVNGAFDGHLTLRSGGSLKPTYANSGELAIGGDAPGKIGTVVVEGGAAQFSHAQLALHKYGRLILRSSAGSISTFTATRKAKPGKNRLDGLLQIDLAKLVAGGTYTLIDSESSTVPIGGALRVWLDSEGGVFKGVGNFTNQNFSVVNGAKWGWTLSLTDKGRDLSLAVYRPGTSESAAAQPSESVSNRMERQKDAIAASGADGWDLTAWRVFPFDYEELSTRTAPLWVKEDKDWMHLADSWVGVKDSRGQDHPSGSFKLDETLKITDFYLTGGGNKKGSNRIFCSSAVPAEGEGPFPVLFVFHGGGGHASGALALAMARKTPGFAAVAVDYNGQFRPSASPVTQWVTLTEELKKSRTLDLVPNPLNFSMYHNVQAARRVMDWTQEQPWADSEKLGAVGISYGGWVSLILAGVDNRIKCVATHVSAGGTEGTHSRSSQSQFWEPTEQWPIWLAHADPFAYAASTSVPVFMELATNDRFFWLSGAARHRDALSGQAAWLLTPNCDHHSGGPDLPDPSGFWNRMVFMNGVSFPKFDQFMFSDHGKIASVHIKSDRPLKSVHLAWSIGNPVSPARYWRWIEVTEKNGVWSAELPADHATYSGMAYFTAVDVDGRAISSDLMKKSGHSITNAVEWADHSLWDVESGAEAWRPDLSFGSSTIQSAQNHRISVLSDQPGKRVVILSNSLIIPEAEMRLHRGIKLELGGNGTRTKIRVILAQDYVALNAQLFFVDVEVPETPEMITLRWDQFNPCRGTTTKFISSANGLVLQSDAFPESGFTVGPAYWVE